MSASNAPPPYRYQSVDTHENEFAGGEVAPDDFKFGVTVEQSAPEIRTMFVRKVYSVLFAQILGTFCIASVFTMERVNAWVLSNSWFLLLTFVGTLVSLGLVYWKRHAHPTNLMMLGLFTSLESISLGAIVSVVDQNVVLKAVIVTAFVFLGLTLYTLQSSYDFGSMATWLYWGLLILVGTGFVQMFFPYNHMFELAYSIAGCAIFSGYVMYDTWLLQRHLSPDDWVLANVSLYLDIVNLFISVLRLFNNSSNE